MLATRFDRPGRIVPGRARGYRVGELGTTGYYPDENMTYKFAGGGMLSTAEDLARFAVALLEGRLLAPETVRAMLTPQLAGVLVFEGDRPATPLRWQQALMWRIRKDEKGRDYVNACGTVKGFNACLAIYLEEELVVATADNAEAVGLRGALRFAEPFRRPATGQ
jgi:CubicO group peptidase (beta-lactamase class C family)